MEDVFDRLLKEFSPSDEELDRLMLTMSESDIARMYMESLIRAFQDFPGVEVALVSKTLTDCLENTKNMPFQQMAEYFIRKMYTLLEADPNMLLD